MNTVAILLRDLVRERTGIHVDDYGLDIFMEKLSSLIDERGLTSPMDYYYLLKYDAAAAAEWPRVVDAVSVRETYFFREMEAIRALVDVIIPQHFIRPGAGPFKIWSAACASGEEPLTIAMCIEEAGLGHYPIHITASDASPAALRVAMRGQYRERSFRNTPLPIRSRYFKSDQQTWQVDAAIQNRITWRNVNLLIEDQVAPLAAAHVIFCRNVFIYFQAETIAKVVNGFARQMLSPALLFVGVAESLLRLTTDFALTEIQGAFVYRRVGEGNAWIA